MITGGCPYCDGINNATVPDGVKLPVMQKVVCVHCNKTYMLLISRVNPVAFRLEQVEIDEDTMNVRFK